MAVQKIVTNSYEALGTRGTRKDNEMTAEVALWLSVPEFAPTPAELADEDYIDAAIKAEQLFPIPNVDGYESRDKEDTIYESQSGNEKVLKRGKRRKTYQLDIPLAVHRALQSFNNGDLRQYRIHDDGKISFYLTGGKAKGFTTSMINTGMMKDVPADGTTPAFTPVMIDLDNWREWDINGEHVTPTWEAASKEGLIPVTLEVVGTPSAASVVIRVYAADGLDELGAVKKTLIKGILVADFVQTFGTATMVDNADGTYTFSGTGFATGTANLKAPSAMVSEGLLIKSDGAVAVTIA